MPELPEVETVCRGLRRHLVGRCITAVSVRQPDILHDGRTLEDFAAFLEGRRILAVERRGKYILFVLDAGWLVCHLRMTGKLLWRSGPAEDGKHTHARFTLDDGSTLLYDDVRRFGGFTCWSQDPRLAPPLSALGPEPLSDAFDADWLWKSTRKRRRPIKTHLLDQSVACGIGNIYADEILFRAGVRPRKSAARLTRKECAAIVQATKDVLSEAIRAGGSTIRDYRDSDARAGSFQLAHQVYGRAGKPCQRCGTLLKSVSVGGRSSVYCPHCQKS